MPTQDKELEQNPTFDIEDVVIFKAGEWNGDKYTVKDLDDMVTSFDEVGDQLKPPMKLGHASDQKLLQKNGYPAAAWVTALKRKGEDLVATLSEVPSKIKTLIDRKAYGRFSPEIYWNVSIDNKKYRRALKAVALLGGDTPACTTMDDFINLYSESNVDYDEIKDYHILKESKMEEKIIEDLRAENKEYAKVIGDKDSELKTYAEKISSLEGEVKELQNKIDAKETEMKDAEIKTYIDSQVKEGKILPAQVEKYTELAKADLDSVKSIVENNPKLVDLSQESEHVEKPKVKEYSAMNEQEKDEFINDKALEYVKENPDTRFPEALEIVSEMMEVE